MGYSPEDLETIAKKLRYDLTAAQGKLSDLMRGISELTAQLPVRGEAFVYCPQCEVPFNSTDKGRKRLEEHMENVHGVIVA